MEVYNIILVDDHHLFTGSLSSLINSFDKYRVDLTWSGGDELQRELPKLRCLPDLILLDVRMAGVDGFQTAVWLKEYYPSIKVLALSTHQADSVIVKMLQSGCRGYLSKDTRPSEFLKALDSVMLHGYYTSEMVTGRLLKCLQENGQVKLTIREVSFLKLCSTEMTYKEIAVAMSISIKTVDGYREALFAKLEVTSRIGLVLYAIKSGIVNI